MCRSIFSLLLLLLYEVFLLMLHDDANRIVCSLTQKIRSDRKRIESSENVERKGNCSEDGMGGGGVWM